MLSWVRQMNNMKEIKKNDREGLKNREREEWEYK